MVGLAKQVRSREESLAGYAKSMTCHLGDFTEYARLRRELSDAENMTSRTKSRARKSLNDDSLARLCPVTSWMFPAAGRPGRPLCSARTTAAGNPGPPC